MKSIQYRRHVSWGKKKHTVSPVWPDRVLLPVSTKIEIHINTRPYKNQYYQHAN